MSMASTRVAPGERRGDGHDPAAGPDVGGGPAADQLGMVEHVARQRLPAGPRPGPVGRGDGGSHVGERGGLPEGHGVAALEEGDLRDDRRRRRDGVRGDEDASLVGGHPRSLTGRTGGIKTASRARSCSGAATRRRPGGRGRTSRSRTRTARSRRRPRTARRRSPRPAALGPGRASPGPGSRPRPGRQVDVRVHRIAAVDLEVASLRPGQDDEREQLPVDDRDGDRMESVAGRRRGPWRAAPSRRRSGR